MTEVGLGATLADWESCSLVLSEGAEGAAARSGRA